MPTNESLLMVVGLSFGVIFPYIQTVKPAAQRAVMMPIMPPIHGLDMSTPMSCNIPRKINTVAGTVAKKPGLYTSMRSISAPAMMSSHPKDNPSSGSTMNNDRSTEIKWYGELLAETG